MGTEKEHPLRLLWRHTWHDKAHDFACYSADYQRGPVGRIYLYDAGPQEGEWFWSMVAFGRGMRHDHRRSGTADTPREAAWLVEQAWETAMSPVASAPVEAAPRPPP